MVVSTSRSRISKVVSKTSVRQLNWSETLPKLQPKRMIDVLVKLFLAASLFFDVFGLSAFASESADSGFVSAVLMQPSAKFFYPEGLPAVIEPAAGPEAREFVIESYFKKIVRLEDLILRVRGTWIRSETSAQTFIKIKKRACDLTPRQITMSGLGSNNELSSRASQAGIPSTAYMCTMTFDVSDQTPSGSISLSLALKGRGNRLDLVLPRHFTLLLSQKDIPQNQGLTEMPDIRTPTDSPEVTLISREETEALQSDVVRLSSSKGFSVGSGFFTRSAADLAKLNTHFSSSLSGLKSDGRLFILTAAHVFPFLYRGTSEYDYLNSTTVDLVRKSVSVNIYAERRTFIDGAQLVSFDLTSDLALVLVNRDVEKAISDIRQTSIGGFEFADELSPDASFFAVGFIASGIADIRPRLRRGWLASAETSTLLTANLGSLPKFLLRSGTSKMASPGMSGGPVLNQDAKVVGLTIEKPFIKDSESATAIDLTRSTVALTPKITTGTAGCQLFYNPFERVLFLEKKLHACNYGDFGRALGASHLSLYGRWALQEVISPVTEEDMHGNVNGTGLIGGTAIINGTGIIGGTAIIGGSEIVGGTGIIHRNNLTEINKILRSRTRGFGLDSRSFVDYETFGVRILETPPEFSLPSHLRSQLIVSVPVYSEEGDISEYREATVRNVLIWLHKLIEGGAVSFEDLLYL